MSSTVTADELLEDIETTLMTLRKPTQLKKVIDSVPKPTRAVPKNGLPLWYRLGLETKLPVPKMPKGKIVFSRGKIGEDVRKLGLGPGPQPSYDLTDPYCRNVSYEYVAMHDPHLAFYFNQKLARKRMKELGFCTKDDRAVCSLQDFNQYRKYLYNRFMDRIHMEINKLDERAKDDMTLKRVEIDVARRLEYFAKSERAREQLERVAQANKAQFEEKKRLAKEQEKKIQDRMKYLAEYNETQRKERAARITDKENVIKQRVHAAAEIELRRKIAMLRQWRTNEKKRLKRLRQDREAKERQMENEANRKWAARIEAQNGKIQAEALLLKIYTDDMSAAAERRMKKAQIYAYNTDLQLAQIRLANLKALHGGTAKAAQLIRKMGNEFEKSKRGAKGMSRELAQQMAQEAMSTAFSTRGDPLMTLGQARAKMDIATVLPSAPVKILEELVENAVMEFARRRVHVLLLDVERVVHTRAANVFFSGFRPPPPKKRSTVPRYSVQPVKAVAEQNVKGKGEAIVFGEVVDIPKSNMETIIEVELKCAKDRPPTPVPSLTNLAEVTFVDRIDDLPDPVAIGADLAERKKLLEMVNASAKLLTKYISARVQKGMDLATGKVTLPRMRHAMDWGEAVEALSTAVVNNCVQPDSADIRRTADYLSHRILKTLLQEMKREKQMQKDLQKAITEIEHKKTDDFYVPDEEKTSRGD